MSPAEWRSADAYEELRSLDAPAFAYEFLRRNPEFVRDHTRLIRKARRESLDESDVEAFAQHWGVRFPPRLAEGPGRYRTVDTESHRGRSHSDDNGGRAGQSQRRTRFVRSQ